MTPTPGRQGGNVLAAMVSFVQQWGELQQELKSTVDVLSEVLQRADGHQLAASPMSQPIWGTGLRGSHISLISSDRVERSQRHSALTVAGTLAS